MYLKDLCNIAKSIIIPQTDLFSSELALESLTYSAGVCTAKTLVDNTVKLNQYICIKKSLVPNLVLSIVVADGIATVITTEKHDYITLSECYKDKQKVYITGCYNIELNGEFTVLDTIDDYTFRYEVVTSFLGQDSNTSIIAYENLVNGYNGFWKVTRIVDTKAFEFSTGYALRSPAGTMSSMFVALDNYISGYLDLVRFYSCYGDVPEQELNKNKFRMGICRGDKSSVRSSLGVYSTEKDDGFASNYNQLIKQVISIYVLCPAMNDITAMASIDKIERLEPIINSAFLGNPMKITTLTGELTLPQFGLYFINSGLVNFREFQNKPYFIYAFNYGTNTTLGRDDTYLSTVKSYKIHGFEIDYHDEDNNEIKTDIGEA